MYIYTRTCNTIITRARARDPRISYTTTTTGSAILRLKCSVYFFYRFKKNAVFIYTQQLYTGLMGNY